MAAKNIAERALEQGKGVLRLSPTWVPRSFCVPGRRIKLHPADYYALGGERGGIDERWFSSTTPADNGPKTSKDEGLSFVIVEEGSRRRGVGTKLMEETLGAARRRGCHAFEASAEKTAPSVAAFYKRFDSFQEKTLFEWPIGETD